ncbi:MAG TPA: hypothetical protein VFM51_08110 [Solirubrobacterales bacterium]|nr:hypothetical protein [Solirubrobacterales bacterium]
MIDVTTPYRSRSWGGIRRHHSPRPADEIGWEGRRTRTAFREDRARDRILAVAGYSVTRLTWNQLDDEPEVIAADLRALLSITLDP